MSPTNFDDNLPRTSVPAQCPPTMRFRSEYPVPPELVISRYFNTAANPTLADLRGEVVVRRRSRCSVRIASPTDHSTPYESSESSVTP